MNNYKSIKLLTSKLLGRGFNRIGKKLLQISMRFQLNNSKNEELQRWKKDNGDQILRQCYDLDQNSVVFDLGGFIGQWSSDIYSRYRCKIFCFEILGDYAIKIEERFKKNQDIKIYNFGLSSKNSNVDIYLHNDGTTISPIKYQNVKIEKGKVVDFVDFIQSNTIHHIDLIKINIEGAEYELLEYLVETKTVTIIDNIQVQFHNISLESKDRMRSIQSELAKTHKLTYQYQFVWENWQII